jgi:hypothetical protein
LNMIGYFIIFDFDGSGDTENRQGIWTRIPGEAPE